MDFLVILQIMNSKRYLTLLAAGAISMGVCDWIGLPNILDAEFFEVSQASAAKKKTSKKTSKKRKSSQKTASKASAKTTTKKGLRRRVQGHARNAPQSRHPAQLRLCLLWRLQAMIH